MHFLLTLLMVAALALAGFALFTWFVGWRLDAAFPAPGRWLEIGGERLHYRDLGQGPPLVLVHGLGGESRNFDYLPLQELARRWRVVLLDRPGSGHSPRRDASQAGIAAQARIVAGFIRTMQFDRPPLLVGHSLGGTIALSVALQDPDCVAGLAVIAPLTHFDPNVPAPFRALAIRTPWIRRWFAHTLAAPLAIIGTRAAIAVLFGPDAPPQDYPVRGGGLRSLRPRAFFAASTDMAAIEDDLRAQQQRYADIRMPLRILFGEGDRILDWRAQGEALRAKVPQADLRIVPGGHMIPVTHPAATAAWLEDAARAVFA